MPSLQTTSKGMAIPGVRVSGPVHGPYAEAWFDEEEQVHRVRLTDDGKARVAEYLDRYPCPIALLISMWPSMYRAARAAWFSEEEINAFCLEGVAMAFVRYDPKRGASIATAVTWSIRASLGNAVRRARRASFHSAHYPEYLGNRAERNSNSSDGEKQTLTDGIAAPGCSRMNEHDYADELSEYLSIANLTEKERYVLMLRYGLAGRPPLSIAAISFAMGFSAERIRQLQEKAVRKIRKANGLDIDWFVATRSRILTYLASLTSSEKTNGFQSVAHSAASKADICKRAKLTAWQFREVMHKLLRDGVVVRERVSLSRERWGIVFRLHHADQMREVQSSNAG